MSSSVTNEYWYVFLYVVQEGVPLASETPVELTQQLTSEADGSTEQTEKVGWGENWFQDVHVHSVKSFMWGLFAINLPENVTVSYTAE